MSRTAAHVVHVLAVLIAIVVVSPATANAEAPRPLLRFPDIHGDQLVFVHAEDIWTAPAAGGRALRLTDDEGEERHPKFSPDSSMIAFTADMGGNPDVYVMAADGSNLRRLTYHPDRDEVVGWHPTRNMVLFRSSRLSGDRSDRLFLIAPDGSGLETLPLHEAGRGSFSADGALIAYNRIAREDRTWKRYHGGMAQDLYLYDFATAKDRRLTDYDGTDRLPMFIGDDIYFASDRDGGLQLYVYRTADGAIEKLTDHTDYDVRRPSAGGSKIVYEVGGTLWIYDTVDASTREVAVEIPVAARETHSYRSSVSDHITSVDCAPGGGRVAVVARGELFTVPREQGPTRNLSQSSGSRERGAVWSPDGENIAYLSDATGEVEIWVVDALGRSPARRITELGAGFRHGLRWSPDGAKIAFTDQTLTLYVIDVASGELTTVDRSEVEPMDIGLTAKPISDMSWSPDGAWLAYSKIEADQVSRIFAYSMKTGRSHRLSGDLFNDFAPVFSADGRHLFFISNRRFDPTFCDFEWQMVYKKVAGIYAFTLAAGGERALPLTSDEAGDEQSTAAAEDDAPPAEVVIDLDGISERVEALPVPRGNYRQLAATEKALYYLNSDDGDYNRFEFRELGPRDLMSFDLGEAEERTVATGVDAFSLSADGSHVAVLRGDELAMIAVEPGQAAKRWMQAMSADSGGGKKEQALDLSGLVMELDPRAEWLQIYDEAWRMERDFYYDPAMHGLDWRALGAKYRQLVERATCRQDLRFAIGELIGELATSHTYVWPGENRREAERVAVGMLGVDWEVDEAANRYRIGRVLDVPDFSRDIQPPLAGPGVGVRQGDYVLAVNGRELTADRSVYAAFQGLAEQQVELLVSATPELANAHTVRVKTVASEEELRYHDWVEHNRKVVDEASGGRIGYIHLPDTYMGSAVEFPKTYYSQVARDGLIIDGRYNGGGLDPEIFLHRLAKKPLSYWTRRYSADQVTPVYVTRAHMVCLTNRQAGSGGDELPYEFQQMGMGPVIGTRTWGGLVGVSMSIPMVDGSGITAPDYRIYTPQGEWTVENRGVTPDIIVDNDPAEMARGWDAQLQKGVEVLLAKIAAEPLTPPSHPPFPKQ